MSAVAEALLTVEEAREIAELHPDKRYELHYGELVEVTQPKYKHQRLESKLRDMLQAKLGPLWVAQTECPYRGTPEHDSRSADVGVVSKERNDQAESLDELFGAPDLVIEILSPSNRAGEMDDKEAFCLAHGCQSFWRINPPRRTVKVTDGGGHVQWYRDSDSISLTPFSAESITVQEIFG